MSQRELAGLAKVPSSTVARIEAGKVSPRFETVADLLGVLGFGIVVCDRHNRLLTVDEARDRLVDRGGRRFPAHLESDRTPDWYDGGWWGWGRVAWWNGDPVVPQFTYWRRRRPRTVVGTTWDWLAQVWDDAT